MTWKFGAATDIGGRSEQQDRLAILHSPNDRRHLVVIADGMGGLQNGAQAAQVLIDVASDRFMRHKNGDPYGFLNGICQTAHHAINDLQNDNAGPAPGTTALLLYLDRHKAFWAHVGDSRLYHFRKGNFLGHTHDHSLLQLMIDKGLAEADCASGEMRNRLYMRLGGETIPEPDFNETEAQGGDVFLLCSDGFWQAVRPSEMIAALAHVPPDQDGSQSLVDLARQRGGNGCDNISLSVVQWMGTTEKKPRQGLIDIFRRCFRLM